MGGEKLSEFSKAKCRALQMGRKNHKCQHRLGTDLLESSLAEKNLGVLVDAHELALPLWPAGPVDPGVHWE